MTDWGAIRQEIADTVNPLSAPGGDFDTVRRRKLRALEAATGRPVILYATDFTNQLKSTIASQIGSSVSIDLSDKDGFHQVTKDLMGSALDVVLYSPGGSAEATDSIVALLRSRFSDIRFIVPSVAKSAATMLAMSGNQILMDEISELGPIDPQLRFSRNGQIVVAPLQSIRDQFLLAQREIAEKPETLAAWVSILQQYGPSLLVECDNLIELAKRLVRGWLIAYMFDGVENGVQKATTISDFLSDDKNFLSHSRRIGMDELRDQGVNVYDMRQSPDVHAAVQSLHIATMLTFQGTGAVKLFENSHDQALIMAINVSPAPNQPQSPAAEPGQPVLPGIAPTVSPSLPISPPRPNRQERRRHR